jgi:hypothetical protein
MKDVVASVPCSKLLDVHRELLDFCGRYTDGEMSHKLHDTIVKLDWMIKEGYDVAEVERMRARQEVRRGR